MNKPHQPLRGLLAVATAMLGFVLSAGAQAQSVPADPAPKKVALIAAIGDRISIVRQKRQVGSHLEPYTRQHAQVDPQPLNNLVLKGLDDGFAQSAPDTQRIFLRWTPPAEEQRYLADGMNLAREQRMESMLVAHLRTLPEREQWDEIVAVLPKWYYTGVKGMGDKLAGVGIYIQPLASEVPDDLGGTEGMQSMSMVSTNNGDHDTATVDPKTGEKGNNSTFVAMFMYMQKITFDAKTLAVKSREVRRDNVKYYDPNSDALDVGKMFDTAVLAKGLSEVVEKSARKAITGNVIVSDLKEVPQPQPAPVKKP